MLIKRLSYFSKAKKSRRANVSAYQWPVNEENWAKKIDRTNFLSEIDQSLGDILF
jgi:hypothetical protein